MLQKIMDLLQKLHPNCDLSITREELIKGRGYLVHYEVSEGSGWLEWIAYLKFTDQSGGLEVQWMQRID